MLAGSRVRVRAVGRPVGSVVACWCRRPGPAGRRRDPLPRARRLNPLVRLKIFFEISTDAESIRAQSRPPGAINIQAPVIGRRAEVPLYKNYFNFE